MLARHVVVGIGDGLARHRDGQRARRLVRAVLDTERPRLVVAVGRARESLALTDRPGQLLRA